MPRSYPKRSPLRRPFLVTPYTADAEGQLVAELPAHCPLSEGASPEASCRVLTDHLRKRKTGPRHPLAVARCGTHECGFTLYPAGYAPYLRQPVLQMAPDGGAAAGDGDDDEFTDTVFAAAVDGKAGRAWARCTEDEDDPPARWWGTQGRHLRLAAKLTGVAHDLAAAIRESIAAVLSVRTLLLREHSLARGYRAIGKAVCDVLGQLRGGGARRALQLLVCGHLIGRWGAPWRWDARRQVVERSPFQSRGTSCGSSP